MFTYLLKLTSYLKST